MTQAITPIKPDNKQSAKLLIMRKKAIAWMMYDADLKKKILMKKKQQPKVRKMEQWRIEKPMAVAG